MTTYTTTIGYTVYFPSRKWLADDYWKAFKVLAHEYVHILDRKRYPLFFDFMYLFPLWIALLSLGAIGAIWNSWFLLFLISLVALFPWPSFPRANLEMRGYAMGLAINIWRHGSIVGSTREWIEEVFAGWDYYRMWPYPNDVQSWISNIENLVFEVDKLKPKETIFSMSEAFEDVYEILTGIENSREGER